MKCPYCGANVKLTSSRRVYGGRDYGPIWLCEQYPTCDAYVGAHRGTTTPLGRLANAELRAEKKAVHDAFDPIWKHGGMRRAQAYAKLAELLGIESNDCHIGMFDVEMCRRARALCGRLAAGEDESQTGGGTRVTRKEVSA